MPLRAANARTLVEQSIGRGLRLPYGKRTGVEAVDLLSIVAHDRFQEIIDEANRGDSVLQLKQVILDAPSANEHKASVQITSNAETLLTGKDGAMTGDALPVARAVMEAIGQYEYRPQEVPTSQALLNPEIQAQITANVQQSLQAAQGELLPADPPDIAALVAQATQILVDNTIDIPRITVQPGGEVSSGFHPFTLDTSGLHLQPGEREILIQNLHTNAQSSLAAGLGIKEKRPEDYIVHALMDFDDIDYFSQSELLYDLAGQMVAHLHSYLSADEALDVLDKNRRLIAKHIHAQMMAHFWEKATTYEVKVSRGFSALKPCHYTVNAGEPVHPVRETPKDVNRIRQMLFGDFQKCLYPRQKFDSDTERRFAVILERDAEKWFKPAKGQFQIYYQLGTENREYIPDFVVETADAVWLAEIKARPDLETPEVRAKSAAAVEWCKHAAAYAQTHGGKPWRYLLIAHDEVNEAKKLADFARFAVND